MGAPAPWILLPFILAMDADPQESARGTPPPPAERVIVVILSGKLAPEEVSPRERSKAEALWQLALEGVTLARVDLGASALASAPIDSVPALLLPSGSGIPAGPTVLFEARARTIAPAATPALAEPAASQPAATPPAAPPAAPPAVAAPAARAIENLRGLFRAPPPETDEELALRRAVAEAVEPPSGAPSPVKPAATVVSTSETDALAGASRPGLLIVRLEASGEEGGVAERNDLLRKLIQAAGAEAHILVASAPAGGEGAIFARGPRFRSGWVIDESRPPEVLASIVRRLAGGAKGEGGSAVDEVFE